MASYTFQACSHVWLLSCLLVKGFSSSSSQSSFLSPRKSHLPLFSLPNYRLSATFIIQSGIIWETRFTQCHPEHLRIGHRTTRILGSKQPTLEHIAAPDQPQHFEILISRIKPAILKRFTREPCLQNSTGLSISILPLQFHKTVNERRGTIYL